jgi:transcriptional regulator with XRE-family HTH domain
VQSSRRVGVNADMVSKWERGQKSPSRFYLRLLCSFFDATPDQLGYGAPSIAAPVLPARLEPFTVDFAQVFAALDGANAAVELLQSKMLELWRDDLLTRRQLLRAMGVAPAAAGGLDAIEATLGILPVAGGRSFVVRKPWRSSRS